MSLIAQSKTNLASVEIPLDTSKFNSNVLAGSDLDIQKAFDKIETLNLQSAFSLDSVSPGVLTVSNAVFTEPSTARIELAVSEGRRLDISLTANFSWSLGLANPGELLITVSGNTPLTKTFQIPYKSSSLSDTLCFDWLTDTLSAGTYEIYFEFRNTDNTGATLTLNSGSCFFAVETKDSTVLRTLSGTVIALGGGPIDNATVSVGSFTTQTDINGEYTLTGLPNLGATQVSVVKTDFKSQTAYVNLSSGDAVKNFSLSGFKISGEITGHNNRPLIDASVTVANVSPTIVFNDGYIYEFDNLSPGTYDLLFEHSNHIENIHQLTINNTDLVVNKRLLPNRLTGTLTSTVTGEEIPNLKFTVGGKLEITNSAGGYDIKDISVGSLDFVTLDDPRFESGSSSVNIVMGDNTYNTTAVPKIVSAGSKGFGLPPYTTQVNKTYSNRFTVNKNILFTGWRFAIVSTVEVYLNVRLRLWDSSGTLLASTTNYYLQQPVSGVNYLKDISSPSTINLIAGQSYSVGIYVETNPGSLVPSNKLGNTIGSYNPVHSYMKGYLTFESPSYYSNTDSHPTLLMPNGSIVYIDPLVKV